MYKRPARVLFLGLPGDGRGELAVRLTAELARDWVEARCAEPHMAGQGDLAWADLVIPLSAAARKQCPPLPPAARLWAWDLPETTLQDSETGIRQRITAMIGGMRMLTRVDDTGAGTSPSG